MPARVLKLAFTAYKRSNSRSSSAFRAVPKGFLPVYVGEDPKKNRFVVPVAYLKHPLFQDLLREAEEELRFGYPMPWEASPYLALKIIFFVSHPT